MRCSTYSFGCYTNPVTRGPPPDHREAPSAPRGHPSRPAAPGNASISSPVRAASGRGEHPLARDPALRSPSESLYRVGTHPPPAGLDRDRHARHPRDRLAPRPPARRKETTRGPLCATRSRGLGHRGPRRCRRDFTNRVLCEQVHSIARLHMPLSTLHTRPYGRPYMTRGRCDWLGLHRATLSFATPHRLIPALLPLLLTGGNTAVWRRRDWAYRGTAPIVLALLAVCSYDASHRLLERFDASELMVRRIS